MLKARHELMVRDWKEDVVYLVQYPRTHTVPTPSPWSLKLETWLRMNGLKYRNVNNEFKHASTKGQVPFVELNGRHFADSNFIIDHLRDHFKLAIDAKLNSQERAIARAFHLLIEESLTRCMLYDRCCESKWLIGDQGWGSHLSPTQKFIFQNFLYRLFMSKLKQGLKLQGYGRHSEMEIEEIAKKDLMAISTLLGEKPFFFGNHPSTLDATVFGHLVQFTDAPIHFKEIKQFIEKNTPNLAAFVERVKQQFWPDWKEICEHLALNPPAEEVEDGKKE